MEAELKWLHSPDINDLENYKPEYPDNFSLFIQLIIGPKGEEGEESFNIEVCTPMWIEEICINNDVVIGSGYIIVCSYDYQKLINTIKKFINNCSGNNWHEIAMKIAKIGYWEFEDYHE